MNMLDHKMLLWWS